MLKKLVLMAATLLSSSAFADHCLQQASNTDLVAELNRRLDGNSSSQGINATAYCNGYYLIMSIVDASGREKTLNESLSTAEECTRQLLLMGKISSYGSGRVVSFCNSYNMVRTQVRADDLVRLNPVSLSTKEQCEIQARQANQQ